MQLGRYQLLARIASGGMADVYKAKLVGIEGFEKIVAIKQILPHWSSNREFVDMLVDEARTVLHLTHSNIVQVFELGLEGDIYFLVMEYVDGVDLRRFQNKLRDMAAELTVPSVLYLAKEIAKGLQYAHEKRDRKRQPLQIVHRDISPQNILLGFEGDIKITDFGIAKVMGKTHETAAGTLKGKFSYMSPEQATGQDVNAQTDLFALGIILFELACGQRCFKADSDIETLEAVKKAEVVFPADKQESLPEGLKKIIQKLLQKNPQDRYQKAADVIDDLLHLELVLGASGGREALIALLKKGFAHLLDQDLESTMIDISGAHQSTIIQTKTELERRTKILVGPDTLLEESRSRSLPPPEVRDSNKDLTAGLMAKYGVMAVFFAIMLGFVLKWTFLSTDSAKHSPKKVVKNEALMAESLKQNPEPKVDESLKPALPNPLVVPIDKKQDEVPLLEEESKIKMADVNFNAFYEIKVIPEGADIRVRYDVKKSNIGKSSIRQDFVLDENKNFFVSVEKNGYMPQTFRFTLDKASPSFVKEIVLSKAAFGHLRVGATPWGQVSIAGLVANSETPFDRAKVPAGTYTVKVSYPPSQKAVSRTIQVAEGKTIHCQVNFLKGAMLMCQ